MKNKFVFYTFFSLLCFLLLTPLVSFGALLFPFVTSKSFFFRIVIELCLPFYVFILVSQPEARPKLKSPLNFAILAFLFINIISALLGVNAFRSFLGNFERMGGVFYLAHLALLYFYLLCIGALKPQYLQRLLKGLVFVSVLISLNGIIGKLGGPTLTPDVSLPLRVSSTLGNPIFLASFLILPFGLSLFFASQAEIFRNRILYIAAALLILITIFLTGTRGALVGLLGGLLVGFVFLLFTARNKALKKWGIVAFGALIILGVFLFVFRNALPSGSIFRRLTEFNDSNAKARLLEWGIALKGSRDYLLLGTGAENYYIIANKNYEPKQYQFDRSWFDKPHNYILEILDTNGIIGLGAYLSFLFFVFWAVFKAYRAGLITDVELAILFGAWTAYQVQNLFVFDTVSASVSLFIFAGFSAFLQNEALENKTIRKNNGFSNQVWAKVSFVGVGIFSLYLLVVFNFAPMALAKNINYGYTAYSKTSAPNFTLSEQYFNKAIGTIFVYDPTELFFKYSDMALAASQTSGKLQPEFVSNVLKEGVALGEKAVQSNPNNPINWYYLAALRYFQAVGKGEAVPPSAQESLQKAEQLAPGRPEIYYLRIQFAISSKNYAQALSLSEEYYRHYPYLDLAAWQLAWVHNLLGHTEQAGIYALEAMIKGYKLEAFKETKLLINYYESRQDYQEVIKLYEAATTYDPNNAEVYVGLVKAYYNAGRLSDAINLAKELVKAEPSLREELQPWLK